MKSYVWKCILYILYEATSKAISDFPPSIFVVSQNRFPRRPSHEMKNSSEKRKIERGWTWPQINRLSNKMNTFCIATALATVILFAMESGIIHFGKIVIVRSHYSCPGNGGNSLEKFCRIFRSPAYLLQFYDRKAMEILNLFSFFQLISPLSFHYILRPLLTLDTSSFSDGREKYIFRINILISPLSFFERVVFGYSTVQKKTFLFTTTYEVDIQHILLSGGVGERASKHTFLGRKPCSIHNTRFSYSIFASPPSLATSFGNTLKWFQVFYHSVFSLLLSAVQNCEIYFSPSCFDCGERNMRANGWWFPWKIENVLAREVGELNFLVRYD